MGVFLVHWLFKFSSLFIYILCFYGCLSSTYLCKWPCLLYLNLATELFQCAFIFVHCVISLLLEITNYLSIIKFFTLKKIVPEVFGFTKFLRTCKTKFPASNFQFPSLILIHDIFYFMGCSGYVKLFQSFRTKLEKAYKTGIFVTISNYHSKPISCVKNLCAKKNFYIDYFSILEPNSERHCMKQ